MDISIASINKDKIPWIPRTLVIGPGGVKGIKALAFLSPLEDAGVLESLDTYCGVSIGALICLLLVCGYNTREIISTSVHLNLFSDVGNFNITDSIEKKGLISNKPIRKIITKLVIDRFGVIPNLYQLYIRTGKALSTVTLNATDKISVIMTPFTHGDICCIDAVLYSMNIPFLFYQLRYNGKVYVDGAFANPYPVNHYDDGETNILGLYMKPKDMCEIKQDRENIFVSNVTNDVNTDEHNPEYVYNKIIKKCHTAHVHVEKEENLYSMQQYFSKVIEATLDQRRLSVIHESSSACMHICLEAHSQDPLGYSFTEIEKATMLAEGYAEGMDFLNHSMTKEYNPYTGTHAPEKYPYPPYYISDEV